MSKKIQAATEIKPSRGIPPANQARILNFATSISESLLAKEFIVSILAAGGGVVLLIGLWMEWKAHKEGLERSDWHSDINDFRKAKRKAKRGQIWVMAGVAIEIIVAVGFAIHDVVDKYEINRNAEANDPRNQPLRTLTAFATLDFSSGQIVSNKWQDAMISTKGWPPLTLTLFSKNGYSMELHSSALTAIPLEYPGSNGLPDLTVYSIPLSGDAEMRQSSPYKMILPFRLPFKPLNAGEISVLDFDVSLSPTFLRGGTVVRGGQVEVWFNSPQVVRRFWIPSQQITDPPLSLIRCFPIDSNGVPLLK